MNFYRTLVVQIQRLNDPKILLYPDDQIRIPPNEGRLGINNLLEDQTACIGKWHLGMQWAPKNDTKMPELWVDFDQSQIDHTVSRGLPAGVPDYGKNKELTDPVPPPEGFKMIISTKVDHGVKFEGEDDRWAWVDRGFQELSDNLKDVKLDDEESLGPIMLQGDHVSVAYRNIRIRKQ